MCISRPFCILVQADLPVFPLLVERGMVRNVYQSCVACWGFSQPCACISLTTSLGCTPKGVSGNLWQLYHSTRAGVGGEGSLAGLVLPRKEVVQ